MFWIIVGLYVVLGLIVLFKAIDSNINDLETKIKNNKYYDVGSDCLTFFVVCPLLIPVLCCMAVVAILYHICIGVHCIGCFISKHIGVYIVRFIGYAVAISYETIVVIKDSIVEYCHMFIDWSCNKNKYRG